jgi:hypothetical protein
MAYILPSENCYELGKIEYNLLKLISDLVYYFTLRNNVGAFLEYILSGTGLVALK